MTSKLIKFLVLIIVPFLFSLICVYISEIRKNYKKIKQFKSGQLLSYRRYTESQANIAVFVSIKKENSKLYRYFDEDYQEIYAWIYECYDPVKNKIVHVSDDFYEIIKLQ